MSLNKDKTIDWSCRTLWFCHWWGSWCLKWQKARGCPDISVGSCCACGSWSNSQAFGWQGHGTEACFVSKCIIEADVSWYAFSYLILKGHYSFCYLPLEWCSGLLFWCGEIFVVCLWDWYVRKTKKVKMGTDPNQSLGWFRVMSLGSQTTPPPKKNKKQKNPEQALFELCCSGFAPLPGVVGQCLWYSWVTQKWRECTPMCLRCFR